MEFQRRGILFMFFFYQVSADKEWNETANQDNHMNYTFCFTDLIHENVVGTTGWCLAGATFLTAIFVFSTNVALINGILKVVRILSRANQLFLFLACTDVLVSLTLSYRIYLILYFDKTSCLASGVSVFVTFFTSTLSSCTVLAIAVERYLLISRQSMHATYTKGIVLLGVVISNVLLSLAVATWSLYVSQAGSFSIAARFALFTGTLSILGLTTVIILNAKLLSVVRQHLAQVSDSCRNNESIVKRHKTRATYTVVLLSLILLVANLPVACALLYQSHKYSTKQKSQHKNFYLVLNTLVLLHSFHSGSNAVVYIYRNKKVNIYYRRRITALLCLLTCNINSAPPSSM